MMVRSTRSVLGLGMLLLAAGCGGAPEPATQEPSEAQSSPASPPSGERQTALVSEHTFPSALMSDPVTYNVFLPPSYSAEPDRLYPVIYWLHGSGGYPPGMLQGLSGRFNGAMRQNKMPEALVVFPDGFSQSNWVNSQDGLVPMEDVFIQEVIPRIEADYRVVLSKEGRLIEGGSMGGYGAARFGLKYPEMFSAISMLNPGPMQPFMNVDEAPIVGREAAQRIFDTVYGGDQAYFQAQSPWQLATEFADAGAGDLKIRIILGANDPIAAVNEQFSQHLDSLSIAHELILLEDAGHNPREMFAALGEDYWTFFGTLDEN